MTNVTTTKYEFEQVWANAYISLERCTLEGQHMGFALIPVFCTEGAYNWKWYAEFERQVAAMYHKDHVPYGAKEYMEMTGQDFWGPYRWFFIPTITWDQLKRSCENRSDLDLIGTVNEKVIQESIDVIGDSMSLYGVTYDS